LHATSERRGQPPLAQPDLHARLGFGAFFRPGLSLGALFGNQNPSRSQSGNRRARARADEPTCDGLLDVGDASPEVAATARADGSPRNDAAHAETLRPGDGNAH
jgi:hypothetical protein